ncbi:CoA transferase [soil metagenome]
MGGIRVISVAENFPGPHATMILSDLGAEVISVEKPDGDPTRSLPGHFAALNRGKRSIVLDLKTSDGVDVLRRLALTADVFVEGYRPGVAARLGIDAETLRAEHPELIYASLSAFGQSGPLSGRGGHDLTVRGMAGLIYADDVSGEREGIPLADIAGATYAVIGIVSALFRRTRTGTGAHLDISMLDSLLAWRAPDLGALLSGFEPSHRSKDPGYGAFRSRDDVPFTLSIAGDDPHWQALCLALGLDELQHESPKNRERQTERLNEMLHSAISARDFADLSHDLEARGIEIGAILQGLDVVDNEHADARGVVLEAGDLSGGRSVRQPVLFDGEPSSITRRAPNLGEHTDEILAQLGL